jgi:meso-butanediol dehydrogenase / (S,S)-butanediol dehydrogenase / diacetyl reductase
MSKRFADKVIIVTGAASGLARAAALGFAREGASLALVDVNKAQLEETEKTAGELGAQVLAMVADISSRDTCLGIIDKTVEHFGKLDVLCNIAGIVQIGHSTDVSESEWQRMVSINLGAPFWLSQAAIPHLIKTHGNIVNCASQSSIKGAAYVVPYSMTKGGVVMMTKSMALEFINEPIRINAVSPGTMATNMAADTALPENIDFTLFARYAGIREAAEPEDVASMFLYVASDEAKSVHGAILCVDGGTTAD